MRRPHSPEIFWGFSESPCSLAMRMDTGQNSPPSRLQHSSWPQCPMPPTMRASSRTPI